MSLYSNSNGVSVPESLIFFIAYHTAAPHHTIRDPCGEARVGRTIADPSMPVSGRLPRVGSATLAGQLSKGARTWQPGQYLSYHPPPEEIFSRFPIRVLKMRSCVELSICDEVRLRVNSSTSLGNLAERVNSCTNPGDFTERVNSSTNPGDLAEKVNSGTSPGDWAERVNSGTNPGDLAEKVNSGTSPGDLAERVNSGTSPGDLVENVNSGTSPRDLADMFGHARHVHLGGCSRGRSLVSTTSPHRGVSKMVEDLPQPGSAQLVALPHRVSGQVPRGWDYPNSGLVYGVLSPL
ncbi:hypothetical protein BHM03_00015712 [Ensete ventricosum]|nr:hypothetical protein BHM03_00015712 [Ensete ventricosum]